MVRAAGEGRCLWCGTAGKVWEWCSELKCVGQNWGEWEYWEGRAGDDGNPFPQGQRGVFTLRCREVGGSQQLGGLCTEQ